jgi:coniferyl-aldehyde dehydrogenase
MTPAVHRMQRVLQAQRAAFLSHPYPTLAERTDKLRAVKSVLRRYQDEIAAAIDADFGGRSAGETRLIEVIGPILQANHALANLRHWMKPSRRRTEVVFLTNCAHVEYQPKGVVGIISPWNFPLYLSLGPLLAALAAGNRAMIKTSQFSPRSTELLARMLGETFPEDEVAVFGGNVAEAKAFSRLPFDHIVFTGSPEVGKEVMRAAAEHLVPVTMELGGKSPAVVAPGADLADAAKRIAHGRTLNGGQTCVAPDYALVQRKNVRAFADAVCGAFRRMYPSPGAHRDYTAVATDRHARRIRDLLDDAASKGARVLTAGTDGPGRRIALRVVTRVRDDMAVMQQEIFGPILPVVPYDTLDDAIAYVVSRPRPLALYAFGFEGAELDNLKQRTHAGGMSINDCGWHAFNHDLPFGGIGNSGTGTYHGEEGFHALSHGKAVYRRHRFFPVGLFYPPYGNMAQRLVMRSYLGAPADAADAPKARSRRRTLATR